jgi:hypothetical protein
MTMSNDRLAELERRLALAEHEAQTMREQLRALQQAAPQSRSRRDGTVVLLGLVVIFAAMRALDTHAQAARPQVLTVKAPFQVMDAAGTKALLQIDASGAGSLAGNLTIGDADRGGLNLGTGTSGAGYIIVRTAAGKDGVAVGQLRGSPMGVRVLGADGQTVQAGLVLDGSGDGGLAIGDENKGGGAYVGVGRSGAGYVNVFRADSKLGIALGQFEGRPMSVGIFGDNAKELVSLRTDAKGGVVKVMNPSGAGVGALLGGDNGGTVALTGPAGGKSAVSLSVEPSGGKVRVFPAGGGPAQAELTAEASGGAVTVYTTAGEAVGLLHSTSVGAGRFEISKAGQVYVEAGVLTSGLGVVRAGPQIGGSLGGALTLPNAILGKSGH